MATTDLHPSYAAPGAHNERRWRAAFAALYAVVLAVGAALGAWVMVAGYSPVPFADFWSEFGLIERGVRGDVSLGDLWAHHNEHRIVLARIQFILDYRFFDGTNIFLFAAIAASSLLLAAAFATAVWLETRDWLLLLGTFSAAAVSTMSPAGIENLTWAFQVQFVQVFLFAAVATLAIAVAARSETLARQALVSAGAALTAVAATYSMANGLLSWPVVVGLAALLGLERRIVAALTTVGVVTVASYFWHLELTTRGSLADPVGLVHFVAIYLGSAVWGAGSQAATVVGAFGLVLLAPLYVLAWKRRSASSVALPFAAGAATFVLLTAVQTAAGRLYLGTSQALSSRYSIASFTFWLALLVGFLLPLCERFRTRQLAGAAYLACAALASLFVGYRMLPADWYLPTRNVGKETAVVAYRAGVEDVSGAVTGVEGGPVVSNTFRWMERHRLGPWAPGGLVDRMRVTGPSGPTSRRCSGEIDAYEPVTRGRRLDGWIAAPNGEAGSRQLVVLDAAGRRSGLGLVGLHRPDVASEYGGTYEWKGFAAYVRREPATPLVVVLLDEAGRSPVCRLTTETS